MAFVGRDTNKQLFHHQVWSALLFPQKNFGKYRKTRRLTREFISMSPPSEEILYLWRNLHLPSPGQNLCVFSIQKKTVTLSHHQAKINVLGEDTCVLQ